MEHILVHADDFNMLGESINTTNKTKEALLQARRKGGL